MAYIVRAVENDGDIPTGFPILLDGDHHIIEPAFGYLIERAFLSGRCRSIETLRTYAEHLHDWFDTLEQSDLDWRVVDIDTIARYRNRMLEAPSPHTGRPYAQSTINHRIRTVCRFYGWAANTGLIDEPPFYSEQVDAPNRTQNTFLAHLGEQNPSITANILTVAEYERLPRPLRPEEIRALLSQLEEPYRLIACWALSTGLRRCELTALTVDQIPDSAGIDIERDPILGIQLSVTKGSKPRKAYAPLRLIDRTHWWIGEERAALIKNRKRKTSSYRAPPHLFLNSLGGPVTKARLTAVFRQAFDKIGVAATLHYTRHTFALVMLTQLQRSAQDRPDVNPLKVVQLLLGHSSIETTAIYLKCVEAYEDVIAECASYLDYEVWTDV